MPEEVRADLLLGRDTLSPGLVKAGQAAADASGNVKQLTRDLYEAGKVRATPIVDLNDKDAEAKLKDVTAKLKELGAKVADPGIDVQDKDAKLAVAQMQVKLDDLGRKVSSPRVTLEGLTRAEAGVAALDLALDKLGAKHATATVDVKQRGGVLGRLGGLFGGGGGAGAAAGAAGAGGGPLSGLPLIGGLGTGGAIAAISAAIAALPFVAQAAAGGIVTALGGGMAAVATYFAAKNKTVRADWQYMTKLMSTDLTNVAKPLIPVLQDILGHFTEVINPLTKAFGSAVRSFAGPLGQVGDTIARTFGDPAVLTSVKALGAAFGAVLKALAPSLPGIIDSIATGITRMANAIKDNPKAFADFIWFLGHVVSVAFDTIAALTSTATYVEKHFVPAFKRAGHDIAVIWDTLWNNTIGRLIRFQQADTRIMGQIRHNIATVFDGIRHDIAAAWDTTWNNTIGRLQRGVADVRNWFGRLRNNIASEFDTIRHNIASAWDTIWNNTVARVKSGISTVVSWFKGLPGRAISALTGLGHSLAAFARAAINEMWTGFKNTFSGVIHWFQGVPKAILHALGIHSPPGWAIAAGKFIMQGLHIGLGHGLGQLTNFTTSIGDRLTSGLSGAFSGGGSGVQRWAPVALAAMRMLGIPARDLGIVLSQMSSESGGNPLAVNLTDINAQNGTPSVGLMQVIGPTFATWAGPFRGTGPFKYGTSVNPLANIYAGLNYAIHRYPGYWTSVLGHGHGYDQGGWLMPGVTLAVNNTGRPEQVIAHGRGGGVTVVELRAGRGDRYGQFLLTEIQRLVSVRGGGDVQVTFGRSS